MHRKLLILLLLCLCIVARGQAVYEYRYWFDGDESTMHTGTSTDDAWQMDFDIGSLDASFHIVHFQVKNEKGVWSVPQISNIASIMKLKISSSWQFASRQK